MKTLLRSILIITLFLSQNLAAQTITKSTFKVKGECGMCKERIETTAKNAGATSANWNANSQTLQVQYDESKVSGDVLLKKIAEVGHDNEKYAAPGSVYENLPGCCLYERTPSFLKSTENSVANAAVVPAHSFFVKGNCGSCKARIEKAAMDAGATSANWSSETQTVVLNFDDSKTTTDRILQKIAEVGHDNEKFLARDDVYNGLPGCCLYDRELAFGVKSSLVHDDEIAPQKDFTQHADHVDHSIDEVRLIKREEATSLSRKSAGLTFNIGQKELLKAACCNLSESFETNATVDVSFSNAVTGTKQLKMLGLDQKYTSLTKELLPSIRGLASPYGMNLIPGRWIGGIQLTKGGSTVTNGYESITGQINTEFLKFQETPETAINFFGDANGRFESNITSTSQLTDHWNQTVLLHGNATISKMDTNKDGFLDQPTGNQVNAAYLLNYNDLDHSGLGSHFGISFVKDERHGGQKDFDKNMDQSQQQSLYGIGIDLAKFDVWNKTGYMFKGKPYQSIGWMNQFTYHEQDSFFGNRNYLGKQKTFYSNLIFESILGNTNHKYKAGASFLLDIFDEVYLTQDYNRTETVPGLFAEYTHTGEKYTLVAGARADFHNLAGTQFTPRVNFKYDFTPKTILRLSAGRGFRTANIFAENQQFFASNREIEILGNGGKIYDLKPEIAWNYGASLQQEFRLFNRKATLVADFFHTDFQDQVLADLDVSPQKIVFYNLEGESFANSFQTQLDFSPANNLDLRLAYKYYDVQADYLDGTRDIPFMAKNRGFFNASYSTDKNLNNAFWSFDTTLQYVGKQTLPDLSANPVEFQLPRSSEPFVTLNAQISRDFSENIRVYIGGENLTGFTQNNPIIDAANPFGNYFDGGMVYAPIMPANFYVGLDFKF